MGDSSFENVKAGDKLMVEGRSFGYSRYGTGPFRMKEWLEVFVEKVTPKSYFVNGEKIPKSSNKLGYAKTLRFPNDGTAPDSSNSKEFNEALEHFNVYERAPFAIKHHLNELPLKDAAIFSRRFSDLNDELASAIAKAKGGKDE